MRNPASDVLLHVSQCKKSSVSLDAEQFLLSDFFVKSVKSRGILSSYSMYTVYEKNTLIQICQTFHLEHCTQK